MLSVVKVRIYPTKSQKVALAKAFGTTRWVWNHFLALTNQTYKDTGKGIAKYDMIKQLPKLKKEEDTEWLKETYSQSLQSVCLNLSQAFVNFFEKRAKYPRFKSKFGKQSLIYPQNVKLEKDKIYFPKLDWIDAVVHRPVKGKVKTVTITKNCCEQYFASILFEDNKEQPTFSQEGKVALKSDFKPQHAAAHLQNARRPRIWGQSDFEMGDAFRAIGIDLGITHFAITSDGSKFDNPRWLAKHENNLKVKQQQLSRRKLNSNNRNKARLRYAKVHNKIARCREDFLHKLSRRIVNENQVVCVENLNVKGMVKNRNLAKAISQVGWGMFCTMLKYKAERDGKVYFEVDRFFPSSKTCNHCLNQVDSLPLDIRQWTCSSCGTSHDRDVNAAKNIRDEGLRLLELGTSSTAYSPDVRRSGGRKKSTATLSVV